MARVPRAARARFDRWRRLASARCGLGPTRCGLGPSPMRLGPPERRNALVIDSTDTIRLRRSGVIPYGSESRRSLRDVTEAPCADGCRSQQHTGVEGRPQPRSSPVIASEGPDLMLTAPWPTTSRDPPRDPTSLRRGPPCIRRPQPRRDASPRRSVARPGSPVGDADGRSNRSRLGSGSPDPGPSRHRPVRSGVRRDSTVASSVVMRVDACGSVA